METELLRNEVIMALVLHKTFSRLWTLESGVIMVVTDLHGDWDAYCRYRDRFVALHTEGLADALVFTGDLIHARPSLPETSSDASLDIVLDVLRLQNALGDAVIYLCGNHELPHIYSFGLSQGRTEFTPAFEKALSQSGRRTEVTKLFLSLPFYLRSAAGVSITHAGAANDMENADDAINLFSWDHQKQLDEADANLMHEDIIELQGAYAQMSRAESYETLARHYLAVSGVDDPRYNDLLRGSIAIVGSAFQRVSDALFTRCERAYGEECYSQFLQDLLRQLSRDYVEQCVLVAGHMTIPGGHKIVVDQHFRLASAHHATPREAGEYLLFDAARPVKKAEELLNGLHSVYEAN